MRATQVVALKPPNLTNGLSIRLIGGLAALIALICSVSFYVIWFQGRPLLAKLSQHAQVQLGQSITLALGQDLGRIEGIAQSMSSIAAKLPNEPAIFHATYPSVLNQLGSDSVIVGGGVWPEEYAFSKDKKRDSYFWGRESDGSLKFYDEYNDPEGRGYHNEEWYVPARSLPLGRVYWSRSYTDPYSLQPMVTCTAPMILDGQFTGVSTVDLKLDGVSGVLEALVGDNSYAFVVDRNNKFISFPQSNMVLTHRKQGDKVTPDFMYLGELAKTSEEFSKMAAVLSTLDSQQITSVKQTPFKREQLVTELAASSYQIDGQEAKRIAAHLWYLQNTIPASSTTPTELAQFSVDSDAVFHEPVSVVVFHMPMTNWKVVTVFRKSATQGVTNAMSYQLISSILLSVLIFGLIAFFALKGGILMRLKKMTDQLRLAVEQGTSTGLELEYEHDDEIGVLVYWYNRRSLQLETARGQAERANQDKANFIAKMSHELRTPLNTIIGFSRRLMLKLEGKLEPRYGDALNAIYRSALHQLDLVNDILDHSSIESGDIHLYLDYEDVNGIVDSVEARMKDLVGAESLEIVVTHLAKDKKIYCDKIKIRQTLYNMMSNAVKATQEGRVCLTVTDCIVEGRASVSFSIADTGRGITIKDQEKLFMPFTQLDNRICVPGTGLGLYLSRYFVSLHSGGISLQSDPDVEPGATFVVTLPVSGPVEFSENNLNQLV